MKIGNNQLLGPVSERESTPDDMVLSGIDELYAAMNTELSCVNILTFDSPGATFNGMARTFEKWQNDVPSEEPRVKEPALRRNAERLIRYGMIERAPVRNELREFPHYLTERGVVASAFSGHTLELANRADVNLTELYGSKVQKVNGKPQDDSPRFSSPLYRTMTLAAIAKFEREHGAEVAGVDIPALPGLEGIEMTDEQKIKHARELASSGFLAITSKVIRGNGSGVSAHHYSISPDRLGVVSELEEILKGVYIIDEDWPDFINEGLRKAREIKQDPLVVACLLETRAKSSQTAYQVSTAELWQNIRDLALNLGGHFTNGQLIEHLGGNHDRHYISNRLGELVDSGVLATTQSNGSNRFQYSIS